MRGYSYFLLSFCDIPSSSRGPGGLQQQTWKFRHLLQRVLPGSLPKASPGSRWGVARRAREVARQRIQGGLVWIWGSRQGRERFGRKLIFAFSKLCPSLPPGSSHLRFRDKEPKQFQRWKVVISRVGFGGRQHVPEGPLSLGVPPCCASRLLWGLGSGPDFSHDTGVWGVSPTSVVFRL